VRQVRTGDYAPEPKADAIARRALASVADRVDTPVATIVAPMRKGKDHTQYPLGNLIADAQRWAGKADIAVMNNGGIRSDLRAGPVTYGMLFELQPFANALYRITASGAAIRGYFERLGARRDGPDEHASGITVTYDLSRPEGSRVVSMTLADGRPVTDSATYTIVINDFMATGRNGLELQHAARSTEQLKMVDLDALVGYLRVQSGPVQPPEGARLVVTGK
jgi:2',3'-cyclic-nucleotide 2'-phosphodiesterase (5'-nucleotidase family)